MKVSPDSVLLFLWNYLTHAVNKEKIINLGGDKSQKLQTTKARPAKVWWQFTVGKKTTFLQSDLCMLLVGETNQVQCFFSFTSTAAGSLKQLMPVKHCGCDIKKLQLVVHRQASRPLGKDGQITEDTMKPSMASHTSKRPVPQISRGRDVQQHEEQQPWLKKKI